MEPLVSAESKVELGDKDAEMSPEMRAILEDDAQTLPLWKIGAIALCFVLVVISNVLKLEFAECGSVNYWMLMMAPVFITVAMMLIVRNYLLHKGAVKQAEVKQLEEVPGDVDWNEWTTITYPIICTVAGLFAGMFGIGGGIVKGPLMLEMGVLPEVSAATAAFMILFTSASATVTYAAFDQVNWTYALVLFPCGILCTTIGQILINGYIKRTNHASVIVFIIASIVGLATVLMGFQSGLSAASDIENNVGMHDICE